MRSVKNTVSWKWFVIISTIALVFFLFAFGREYISNIQIQNEIEQLVELKDQQEQTRLETMDLISQLSSEYYLEQEGRIKQGLGRDGEVVVIIQDDINSAGTDDDFSTKDSKISNVIYWFYYFFSREEFMAIVPYEGD
jgi:cell division protein FtsB